MNERFEVKARDAERAEKQSPSIYEAIRWAEELAKSSGRVYVIVDTHLLEIQGDDRVVWRSSKE